MTGSNLLRLDSQTTSGGNPRAQAVIRSASLAGGGAAAFAGWRRGGWPGILLGLLGGVLVYKGVTGHIPASDRLPLVNKRHKPVHLRSAITIERPADELYSFWRDFPRLAQVMRFIDRIENHGDLSHWVVKGPRNIVMEWDTEVVDDVRYQLIAWRSVEGSPVHSRGEVRFRPGPTGRGTEVHVSMHFQPPGKVIPVLGHLLDTLETDALTQSLRDLKAYMETGETATNAITLDGRSS